mgnify:CR=1 FL=1
MKKRTANEEKLSNVINDFIDRTGLRQKFQEQEILQYFKEIMGTFLMKKVQKSYVRNQKLYLKLSSAAFKQELIMQKTNLLLQLNSKIGDEFLIDLVLI